MAKQGLTVDTKEFDKALLAYYKVSSRTWPQILNGKAADLLYKAEKHQEKSSKAKIEAFRQKPYYIKFLSDIVASNFPGLDRDDFNRKLEQVDKKIIAKRIRSISFLKAGWIIGANKFPVDTGNKKRARRKKGKFFPNIKTKAKKAKTGVKPFAEATITWGVDSTQDKAAKEALLATPLQLGRDDQIKDMMKRVNDVQKKLAKKYSAK